ncbi:MAG: hypothetical protein C0438_03215 [Pseudomonas sp.]|nr:hypothetical protein [Pseudomonas sp.]
MLYQGSPQPLWERACSRRGRVSQHLCNLTHPIREQARSHMVIGFVWDRVSPAGCRCRAKRTA